MKKFYLKCLVMLPALMCCFSAKAEETIKVSSIKDLVNQRVAAIMLKQIYKKIGVNLEVMPLPGKRAIAMSTSGKTDGELLRVHALGEKHSSLIRVPTPISEVRTAAFSKTGRDLKVYQKADLGKYKSVIVRGVLHTESFTDGVKNIHIVNRSEQMFPFIQAGRADIALTSYMDGLAKLKKGGITDLEVIASRLAAKPLYHYIHKSKADLVPRLDAVLKKMQQSGELKKLRLKLEKEYLANLK